MNKRQDFIQIWDTASIVEVFIEVLFFNPFRKISKNNFCKRNHGVPSMRYAQPSSLHHNISVLRGLVFTEKSTSNTTIHHLPISETYRAVMPKYDRKGLLEITPLPTYESNSLLVLV